MRTLRLSLTGTVILVLLGGLSGAVVAQDEPADPMAHAVVTGTIGFGPEENLHYEASDPRLDGEVTLTQNRLGYETPGISIEATVRVLENDDGRWVGTDTGLGVSDSIVTDGIEYDTSFRVTYLNIDFIVLHGEDAYEGLTAVIVEDWEAPFGEPATFVGAIVPEMPAFPELPTE